MVFSFAEWTAHAYWYLPRIKTLLFENMLLKHPINIETNGRITT